MQVHRLQIAIYSHLRKVGIVMGDIWQPSAAEVGERDRKLLALLRQNARRTISEMAAILGVSRTVVKERMDRLVAMGIIRQFTIRMGGTPQQRPPGLRAFFHVQLHRPVCQDVYGFIEGWPELVGCWSITGKIDMVVLVDCAGQEEVERLRDRLARHPEVRRLRISIALRQWRWQDEPPAPRRSAPLERPG
jgi:Lrp/AsnC family transcriptional regulator, leucine-responsive regulatory protein